MSALKSIEASLMAEGMKLHLMKSISTKCEGMVQREIAEVLGLTQPRVSNLINCKIESNFSMESLIAYAIMLGIKVELSLT